MPVKTGPPIIAHPGGLLAPPTGTGFPAGGAPSTGSMAPRARRLARPGYLARGRRSSMDMSPGLNRASLTQLAKQYAARAQR